MRFSEIASPEDQLALWKMVSDKMWAAFGQPVNQQPSPILMRHFATSTTPKVKTKPITSTATKPLGKRKATPVKTLKPMKAPMAPLPKPLPKPQTKQLIPTHNNKQQQQLAQQLHKEIVKSKPQPQQRIYPQSPIPSQMLPTPTEPLTSSYDERDKDELVIHSLTQHPFKTVAQVKSAFSGQKRCF